LNRWHPSNVLMLGIAGGVRGKVELGDVVVAKFVFYYELAKLTLEGEQLRPNQFPTDQLLYTRAYVYEATEWKGMIEVLRPGHISETSLPNVHFDPIASGEKVIADEETIPKLVKVCPKLVAVAMEGAGVARAARNYPHGQPPRFLEIRGICDFADPNKNDDWHDYAANAAAAFAVGWLRDRPMPPLVVRQALRKNTEKPLLIICAQSLRVIAPDEILSGFNDDLKRRDRETVSLDFTRHVQRGVFTDPESAVQQLTDPQGLLSSAIARCNEAELVFHGLAHIPLLVLIGHLVSGRLPVRLFDFQSIQDSDTWAWADEGQSFPPMEVNGLSSQHLWHGKDVVLRVSVTRPVLPPQTLAVAPPDAIEIDLTLPHPERGIVRSEKQTREYGRVFRQTLDTIAPNLSPGQRIHLFYAGPVTLAFHIGQQISENIHPPVTVWNYHQGYDWGIDLAAAYMGEECVVRS
ncbi:MAG: SAVED domain-containing protein, partial [Coleofasciculus sp. Co-bin14]|nr:SAVED domain-containing protein [Coleofasciculus sp. Co-bin14]